MNIAKLALDYLQALVWPTLLVFALLLFRGSIRDFLNRASSEGEELSASVFGIELRAKFRETQREIENLAHQADSADTDQLRQSVKETAHRIAQEQFRALSSGFYGTPLNVRQEVAEEITQVANSLELEDVLTFARSQEPGQRVGAAIALGAHMQSSLQARDDPKIHSALRILLGDSRSRVRYRAVEALQRCPDLVPMFASDLSSLASTETNPDVRNKVLRMLRSAES
ncbi:HEAT repeat domain-containing protein [Streptomyces sp. HC44]|uniref:HEAT repeat domain-containing protein n=1 Tax=Streptomyces scabichelini TaxID=2711217 RepID=A0A6G4V6B5_9ACTN|nr:HEAT repeat domain-containing protein [Streptomyces scabichelini]NGO09521.1 HEAT repeat domain-containing protein [Streptomyces scabichelini]